MRPFGWMEMQCRSVAAHFARVPSRAWLRWAREAHHGDVALACLDRAVRLGDADALFEQGLLEAGGVFGTEPAPYFRRAAQQGHLEAMLRLADCLRWGPGLERNPEDAKTWLLRAAEAGFRPAAESLAKWQEDEGEMGSAAAWRERARAMAPRTLQMGLMKAVASRDPVVRAQAAAAQSMATGLEALMSQPWVPPVFTVALIGVGLVSLVLFVIVTIYSLGLPLFAIGAYYLLFGRRQRHSWRFRRLVDAAEGGDAEAAFRLGSDYLRGMPGVMPDALSAAIWFRRAAESGHRGAMAALGEALQSGHGIRRDAGEAEAWLKAARA